MRLASKWNFHDMLNNMSRTLFWIHACPRFSFTILGSSTPTVGLLHYNYEEKLGFWQWGLLGEALGHLDLLATWTTWVSWTFRSLGGALGFLTSKAFGNLGNLGLLGYWAAWISWTFGSLWGPWSPSNLFWIFLGRILGLIISWDCW